MEPNPEENLLWKSISEGSSIRTSRCGDIQRALHLLSEDKELTDIIEENIITSVIPLSDINRAFEIARSSHLALKVVIDCNK